jgi:hypothetical protein
MRRPVGACAAVVFFFVGSVRAGAADSDLLYFSGDLISGRNYAGVGWTHAFAGLDATGFVITVDGGASQFRQTFADAEAGWRIVSGKFYLTLNAGLDVEPRLHPLASADLWWEPTPGWMAQARFEAATDWTAWRVALGWRPNDLWPWIGPEAAGSAAWPRAGLQATGFKLPFGAEAAVSSGVAWREGRHAGPYATLSVWRRF